MKFKISNSSFKAWLDIVNHASVSITTTPILENILIKVNFNNIVLISNNLELAIEYVINDDVEIISEWAFSVSSKLLTNFIWFLSDDYIEVELLKDDSLHLKTKSSDVKIKWIEASEFPLIPNLKEEETFSISSKLFKTSIEKTLFSAAEWNIRPTLAWIYFNIENKKVVFASTDSFRLTELKTDIDSSVNFSQIIPSKTCFELSKIIWDDDSIKIVSWESQIAFYFGNVKIFSRLLNGKFPDYSNFFPSKYSTKCVLSRRDLMQALKKINLISRENNYSVKVSFSWELWILIETSETQIWEWKETLVWSVEWEDNIIWLNSVYFLEALNVMDSSHISISFESALSPILVKPVYDNDKQRADYKHIIMPLKINL